MALYERPERTDPVKLLLDRERQEEGSWQRQKDAQEYQRLAAAHLGSLDFRIETLASRFFGVILTALEIGTGLVDTMDLRGD